MSKLTTQVGEAQPTNGLEAQIKKIVEEVAAKAKAAVAAIRTKTKPAQKNKAAKRTKVKEHSGKKTSLARGFGIAATATIALSLLAACGPTQTQETTTSTPARPGYEEKVTQPSDNKRPEKEIPESTVSSMPENSPEPSNSEGAGIDDDWADEPAGDIGLDEGTDGQQHQPDNSPSGTPNGGVGQNEFSANSMAVLQEYLDKMKVNLTRYCENSGCSPDEMAEHIKLAEDTFWDYVFYTKGFVVGAYSLDQAGNPASDAHYYAHNEK